MLISPDCKHDFMTLCVHDYGYNETWLHELESLALIGVMSSIVGTSTPPIVRWWWWVQVAMATRDVTTTTTAEPVV